MRNACDVDPYAVGAIDIAVGAIAAAPACKLQQCDAVTVGLGGSRGKSGQCGTCIGKRLPNAHTVGCRLSVDGGDANAMAAGFDERKGCVIRHGGRRGTA